jgi:hypothetical protein
MFLHFSIPRLSFFAAQLIIARLQLARKLIPAQKKNLLKVPDTREQPTQFSILNSTFKTPNRHLDRSGEIWLQIKTCQHLRPDVSTMLDMTKQPGNLPRSCSSAPIRLGWSDGQINPVRREKTSCSSKSDLS